MKVNVKRSELLRFYFTFNNTCPTALNKVYLTFCPNDFFLLAKVIGFALSKNITLRIQYDDQTIIHPSYQTNIMNKIILQDVLNVMDDSSFLNDHGTIGLTLGDGLSVLVLLENLLLENYVLVKTHSLYAHISSKKRLLFCFR
jgi:hypothetical protein